MTIRPPSPTTIHGAPLIRQAIFDGVAAAYVVAFGWVAFAQPSLDQLTLYFWEAALAFALLSTVGAILSVVMGHFEIRTLGAVIFAPPHRRLALVEAPKSLHQTFWGCELIILGLVTLLLGFVMTEINLLRLFDKDAIAQAGRLFQQLFTPDWAILPKAVIKVIQTVYIAFMATAIAVPIAFVLSFLSAKNLVGATPGGAATYAILRTLFNITRSIEPIIWAIIFSVWVSFGPFAGMLALLVHSISSLAKQYSEIIESVDDGPIEGIQATGAGRLQTIRFAVVPQVLLPFLSYTMYRWDTNVRSATILGIVGGGGIGTMLMEYLGQSMWHQVGTIVVVISTVVWAMDAFSAHVRAALK